MPDEPITTADGIRVGGDDSWPIYRYGWARQGLMTRRQLRAAGLRPGGHPPVAEIRWTHPRPGQPIERRVAYLYDVALAKPKRVATPRQLEALAKCMRVRSTCGKCGVVRDYCISHALGMCNDCYAIEQERAS